MQSRKKALTLQSQNGKERCSSGWRGTPGKRVYAKSVSRVPNLGRSAESIRCDHIDDFSVFLCITHKLYDHIKYDSRSYSNIIGSGLGGVCRYLLSKAVQSHVAECGMFSMGHTGSQCVGMSFNRVVLRSVLTDYVPKDLYHSHWDCFWQSAFVEDSPLSPHS